MTDAVDINKDAEAEAAAAAAEALAASNDGSKKAQKGGNVSPTKKKPNPIATGKPGDKQQTVKSKQKKKKSFADFRRIFRQKLLEVLILRYRKLLPIGRISF